MSDKKFIQQLCRLDIDSVRGYLSKIYEEKNILNGVLDSIQAMIIATDEKHSITYCNHYAKKILQIKKSPVSPIMWHGKSILSMLEDGQIKEKIRAYIEDNQKLENVDVHLNGYHSIKMGNLSAFSMTKQGKIIGFTYVLFDNTMWTTRYLERNQKLSISSLKMLTAGIAHEIKNPLGALDLHFQLIERFIKNNFSSNHKPKQKELTELTSVVKQEISRLNNIIEDFLLSVRPIKSTKEIANLNEVVRYALDLLKPKLKENKIKLKVDLSSKIPLYRFDKKYFVQLVVNLIQNSIDAISETNRVGKLWVVTLLVDDKIVLEVIDNGCGVKKKEINKIFEPFYSSKQKGTGLGLIIVSKVVQEHDGDIIITSDADKGMEIRMEFPLTSPRMKLLN